MEKAINFEVERQIDLLESGGEVVQETRLYDEGRDETRSMRSKEEANDYRYFPDPDLLPVEFDQEFVDAIAAEMPELPDVKRQRLAEQYGLSAEDASALSVDRDLADYFELVVAGSGEAKLASNWIMGDLAAAMNRDGLEIGAIPISAAQLGGLLQRISDNTISGRAGKEVFEAMWSGEGSADEVIAAKGLQQITDSGAIEKIVDEVIAANPQQVDNYRSAEEAKRGKMIGFFVGQVMKASQGKANPQQVNQLLQEKL
jgi:aspartyl-tRNA(Asn)/glutamyl-tRNA(Gln) amidotransferase subunit B